MDWYYITELLKNIFAFSGNAIQSILAYVGIISFIYFLFPKLENKMKDEKTKTTLLKIRKYGVHIAWVFVLVSIALASHSVYDKANQQVFSLQRELHKYQTQPTVDQMLMMNYLKGIPIPLPDLAKDITIIRDKTFDSCDIHGPAVILLDYGNNQVFDCTIDVTFDIAFFSIANPQITGVIAFDNCVFKNCKFKNISFIGTPEEIEKARSEYIYDGSRGN
jgi:hypothetical protein